MENPRTRYARSGDAHIAYQVFGEGEFDVVVVPGFVSNIDFYGRSRSSGESSNGPPRTRES
jgi:hypothetical protein